MDQGKHLRGVIRNTTHILMKYNVYGTHNMDYWDKPNSLRALKAVARATSSGFFCMKAAIISTIAGREQGSFR